MRPCVGRRRAAALRHPGSVQHPPEPADVFTCLLDTSLPAMSGGAGLQLWLPSGRPCEVSRGRVQPRVWHDVRLEFDWAAKRLRTALDGTLGRVDVPFGAHPAVEQSVQHQQPAEAAATTKLLSDMDEGLRHIYLFTWLERATDPPPEVHVADIWFES